MKTTQEMARAAGFERDEMDTHWASHSEEIEAFAKLVREDEREEIAQYIERTELKSLPKKTAMHYALFLKAYAVAIRARGQA